MPWLSVCVDDSTGTNFRPRTIKEHGGSCTVVPALFAVVTRNTPVHIGVIITDTDQHEGTKGEDGVYTVEIRQIHGLSFKTDTQVVNTDLQGENTARTQRKTE